KIQTIHSFCAAILRRFPLEAGVAPQFQEMDERTAKLLQQQVLDDMAAGPDRAVVEGLAANFTDVDFDGFIQEIASHRDRFDRDVSPDDIWAWVALEPGFDEAALEGMALRAEDASLLANLTPLMAQGKATDSKNAAKLAVLDMEALSLRDLPVLEDVFLTGAGTKEPFSAKIGSVPTKEVREGPAAHLMPALEDLMRRIERARHLRTALETARKTLALHRFARPFLAEYDRRKQAHGWLDFDDLITRAGRLLNDPGLAAWVLYRLDGGIDHILVDEAQDTSPAQWRVIESLAREFTSGESARSDHARTLFVVGDLKQSIYSFQGADPGEFTRMRDAFDTAFQQVGQAVKPLELEYSFRSARAILDLVDLSLDGAQGLGDKIKHIAFDNERPGRVDLWPIVEKPDAPEGGDWRNPVDMLAPEDAPVLLAQQIAATISDMLETGSIPAKNGGYRPIEPGDIMVLVRRRSDMFHEIIRACKKRNLPIAGADVLRIGGELAVKDITALLAFLATPEDDLSLAAALRSPLLGLSEDDLYHLAHDRGDAYLWAALREGKEAYPNAVEMLDDLRGEADYLRPYDLIERILTRHDGRRRLIARLGPDAEDGIDALLAQALSFERLEVPSLTGFLFWLGAEDVRVKRQMDSAGNQIRVMTVHGAKGLEAPVVFLPDTGPLRSPPRDKTIECGDGRLWRAAKAAAPDVMQRALAAESEKDWEEYMRLLYVAMTRAESWLIVAGAGDMGKPGEGKSWYRIVETGMDAIGASRTDFAGAAGWRFQSGDWGATQAGADDSEQALMPGLPEWAGVHAVIPPSAPAPLVPSKLGGAKAIGAIGDDPATLDDALRYGRQLHRLLEFLPEYPTKDWPRIARDLLAYGEDRASDADAATLLEEARRVLEAPALSEVFAGDALAEVEISSPVDIAGARRLHGVIDRLLIRPDHVLAIDFRTNREVPDSDETVPEGILRQMGAYESALTQVYPDRRIETAILWTKTASLMRLPPGQALRAF
ncbi:MAG TPA: double-strand break repair helicase AddA, partial [Rhodobacterales bacterium]|nr:double-strand break repair helicase AddA [Rhodobacterales bacterium]